MSGKWKTVGWSVCVCVWGGGDGGGGSLVAEGAGIEYLFAESLVVSYHFCSQPNAVCGAFEHQPLTSYTTNQLKNRSE